MSNVLGIDIGGSTIKSGIVSETGKVFNFQTIKTSQRFDQILVMLKKIISDAKKIEGIGICLPAIIDEKTGVIKQCLNIPVFSQLNLISFIRHISPIGPIRLINDADAALLGEHWIGAAVGYQNVVMLTLGTGVGGAVIDDGILLPHPKALDEEIGHLQVDADDKYSCNVGVAGSIEAKIGGYCVKQRYSSTLEELAEKARGNNDEAKNHFTDISYWFHAILELTDKKYHPDIFVIGGSGAESLDLFLDDQDPIKPVFKAKLGNQAGIIGVAKKVLEY